MPCACSRGQPLLDRLALLDHVSLDQGPRLVLLLLYLLHVGFDLLYLLFILLLVRLLLEPGGKVSLWSALREWRQLSSGCLSLLFLLRWYDL